MNEGLKTNHLESILWNGSSIQEVSVLETSLSSLASPLGMRAGGETAQQAGLMSET